MPSLNFKLAPMKSYTATTLSVFSLLIRCPIKINYVLKRGTLIVDMTSLNYAQFLAGVTQLVFDGDFMNSG